jgi:hypothetical protein
MCPNICRNQKANHCIGFSSISMQHLLVVSQMQAIAAGVSPSRLHDPRFGQALIRRLAVTNFDQQTRDMLARQLQAQQRAAR